MKTYLLNRYKHNLIFLIGGLIGLLLAFIVNKKVILDSDNIYFFKWIGIGLILSEVVFFFNWLLKKNKT